MRQDKAEVSPEKLKEFEKERLTREYRLLRDIKSVMGTDEGKRFVKWIFGLANIYDDVFSNSGYTAYNLGIQHIGKKVMCKLIDAGCRVEISDLMPSLNSNRINDINNELHKLTEDK